MWAAALAIWHDETTRYLFFPEKIAQTPIEQLRADLVKYRLGFAAQQACAHLDHYRQSTARLLPE